MSYRIELDKENFKFSSSHFTIFSRDKAERLHGHNYYTSCEILLDAVDGEIGMAFDFNLVKPMIREITEALDEYVLVPMKSPFLDVREADGSTRIRFGQKEYVIPSEDVRQLPVVNITSEELARYITGELVSRLRRHPAAIALIREVRIGVQESRGQTVFFLATLR